MLVNEAGGVECRFSVGLPAVGMWEEMSAEG